MARYPVATVDEIQPGRRKIVTIGGRSIGVFNVDGRYYAVRNQCPHAGGPLCEGPVGGLVESAGPGEYTYSLAGRILRCPWHGWEFDLATGTSWFDPAKTRVRAYRADVEHGGSLVEDDEDAAQRYQAEMYPVDIEQDYVVVHF